MYTLAGLIDVTDSCLITAPNVTEHIFNIDMNNFFFIQEGKCVNLSKNGNHFYKKPHRTYSEAIPYLHPYIYTGTWMKRTWTKFNYNFISLNFNPFDHWLRSDNGLWLKSDGLSPGYLSIKILSFNVLLWTKMNTLSKIYHIQF